MATRFDDWEGDFLAHYGTKGMKWGQRRYQNEDGSLTSLGKERYGVGGERTRRGIKRDLNKLDREQAQAQVRADYYSRKATRKISKLEKKRDRDAAFAKEFREMGNDSKYELPGERNSDLAKFYAKSARGYQQKINKIKREGAGKKADDYNKLLSSSRKMTEKIIKSATAKGYSIKSRECVRQVNKGRNIALTVLGGVAAATTGVGFMTGQYTTGKHYKVKNDGLGTVTHKSGRRIAAAYSGRR